jgi:hypothetical protein
MSEQQKHSAGPWQLFVSDAGCGVSMCKVKDANGKLVANGRSFRDFDEDAEDAEQVAANARESLANGRLLTAAPDLLAACQRFLKEVANDNDDSNGFVTRMLTDVAPLVRDAIAKAGGN